MDFFFYGTLLDRRVRRAVIGPAAGRLDARAATLHGWRRVRLQGRLYPVIVPAPQGMVEGCLFGPLPASAVVKLVRFEGPEYRLVDIEAVAFSGAACAARTFIGSGRTPATTREWHFEEWERRDRPAFLRGIDASGVRRS